MGGLRRFMPATSLAFVIATLAIAGVPPFAGFWAKDDVLSSAFFGHDYGVYAVGLIAALLTALYMTREVMLVFYGNERFHAPVAAALAEAAGVDDAAPEPSLGRRRTPRARPHRVAHGRLRHAARPARARGDPHEGSGLMVMPVAAARCLAIVGGLLDLPFQSSSS